VIWAADVPASSTFGLWSLVDPTAAGGKALWNTDKAKAKISPPLAAPTDYFDVTVNAMAGAISSGCAWAQSNSLSNDSVSVVQRRGDAFGSPLSHRRGHGRRVILQDGTSGSISGWGWAENGFGNFAPTSTSGDRDVHTIRAAADRRRLSRSDRAQPDLYTRTAPGAGKNDDTILGSTIAGRPAAAPPRQNRGSGPIGTVSINGMASYDAASGSSRSLATPAPSSARRTGYRLSAAARRRLDRRAADRHREHSVWARAGVWCANRWPPDPRTRSY
jgi:hypothetical protein